MIKYIFIRQLQQHEPQQNRIIPTQNASQASPQPNRQTLQLIWGSQTQNQEQLIPSIASRLYQSTAHQRATLKRQLVSDRLWTILARNNQAGLPAIGLFTFSSQ